MLVRQLQLDGLECRHDPPCDAVDHLGKLQRPLRLLGLAGAEREDRSGLPADALADFPVDIPRLRPKSHAEAKVTWSGHGCRCMGVLLRLSRGRTLWASSMASGTRYQQISAFYSWAIDRGYCGINPSLKIKARHRGGSRTRVLTEDKLVQIWRACGDHDYGYIVKLLIMTGQRRAEIGDLAWSEVDMVRRQIDLPERRTKNGRPHIVPLSDQALAILSNITRRQGRDFVFGVRAAGLQGWSESKASVDALIAARCANGGRPMPPWMLHDLRRSFVTHVSELGFASPHVVEAIVNHVSGTKAGVAGVYNRASYLVAKRQALERWSAHLSALLAARDNKIVPLRRSRATFHEA